MKSKVIENCWMTYTFYTSFSKVNEFVPKDHFRQNLDDVRRVGNHKFLDNYSIFYDIKQSWCHQKLV